MEDKEDNLVSPENIDLDVGSKVNNRSHVNGRKSINSLREELADVMFKCKIREIKNNCRIEKNISNCSFDRTPRIHVFNSRLAAPRNRFKII